MRSRVAAGVAGLLALGCALALGGRPSTTMLDALVALLGNDYFVIATVAGLGLLVGMAAVLSGGPDTLRQAETPTPERPVTAPVAGDAVDATLASRTAFLPVVGGDHCEDLQQRLRTAAINMWVHRGTCSRTDAIQRLNDGTWTADDDAAAFLAGRDPGVAARLVALRHGEPWARRAARRAVKELTAQEDYQ